MKTLHILKIVLLSTILLLSRTNAIPGGNLETSPADLYNAEKYAYYMMLKNEPFSEYALKMVMWYERLETPDIVLLQAQLETGFYTSDIFRNGNNLFGMKLAKRRPTVAIGEYKGHAQYEHWIDSVIDYKMWQEWYMSVGYRIKNNQSYEYLVFLNCIKYAEDPRYIHKLVKLGGKDIS